MKNYIIEVKGEIVANAQIHYAQEWTCCDISSPITDSGYSYEEKTHTVNSDLLLNENLRAVPYAVYFTQKGISTNSTGDIAAYPGYGAAWEYYKENISKISNLLKLNVISVPLKLGQVKY